VLPDEPFEPEEAVGGALVVVVVVVVPPVTSTATVAVLPEVSPVTTMECAPAGVSAGIVTFRLKAPVEFVIVEPSVTGLLWRTAVTVSEAPNPLPVNVIAQDDDAEQLVALAVTVGAVEPAVTVRVKDWVASGEVPLAALMVIG
jgi:hypothetical protein